MIAVKIQKIFFSPEKKIYVVSLIELDGSRKFTMPISIREAQAIAGLSEPVKVGKHMTYNFIFSLVDNLGGRITCLRIDRKTDGNFISELEIMAADGKKVDIDCTNGDGIIMALKCRTPILVQDEIIDEMQIEIKSPVKKNKISKESLENDLMKAIEIEDYELAATIRDKIKECYT